MTRRRTRRKQMLPLAIAPTLVSSSMQLNQTASISPAEMNLPLVVGFLAALMLLFCQVESLRGHPLRLTSAACFAALSAYAFVIGAWPLGMVLGGSSFLEVH